MGAGDRLVTVPGAGLMPSYRVAVDVHGVAPGTAPESLLPRAVELLGRGYLVEDSSVEMTRGQPQIHLRFLVPGGAATDDEAEGGVRELVDGLEPIAVLGRWWLRRGPGRHWRTVRTGHGGEGGTRHPGDR